jgi:hypothetical protein
MILMGCNSQRLEVTTCLAGVACTVCAMASGAGTLTQIAGTMTEIAGTMTRITSTMTQTTGTMTEIPAA